MYVLHVLIHFWKRVLTEISLSLSYSEIAMGEASILDIFTTNGGQWIDINYMFFLAGGLLNLGDLLVIVLLYVIV